MWGKRLPFLTKTLVNGSLGCWQPLGFFCETSALTEHNEWVLYTVLFQPSYSFLEGVIVLKTKKNSLSQIKICLILFFHNSFVCGVPFMNSLQFDFIGIWSSRSKAVRSKVASITELYCGNIRINSIQSRTFLFCLQVAMNETGNCKPQKSKL